MKQRFFCTILLFFSYISFSQTITINILSPTPNQVLTDTTLNIVVTAISSAYEISGVTASVQGRQTQLVYSSTQSNYTGKISLNGLPQNSNQILEVIATAGQFDQNSASVAIIYNYDSPPVLVIDSLLDGSNANPLIRIKATAIDNNTDSINITIYAGSEYSDYTNPYFNQNFVNPIDSTFDLSAYVGNYGYMVFTAKDSVGKIARDTAKIFIENSPYLEKVFTADQDILDFNYNKVITYNDGKLKITDITSGQAEVIPYTIKSGKISPGSGQSYLTPYGAIFSDSSLASYNDSIKIIDWNNGSLYVLGNIKSAIKVMGNFATWSYRNLYLRDLQNLSDKVVSTYYGSGADVATNGNMAFINVDRNLLRYVNNVAGLLTNDGAGNHNLSPLTDGKNIIFSKVDRPASGLKSSINLWNGIFMREISSFVETFNVFYPVPMVDYQVNNNWIAYIKRGPTGIKQVWIRDTASIDAQQTFSNINSTIDLLGPQGDFIGIRGARRFYKEKASVQSMEFASTLGKTYFRDSSWYVVLGHSVYRLALDFSPAPYTTVADGLWSDPATWANNAFPPAGADIIIRTNVIADINITCNSLKVEPPGGLVVNTGVTVTILNSP